MFLTSRTDTLMASDFPSIRGKYIGQIILYFSCYYFLFLMPCFAETDTMLQGQALRNGEYLISANKVFKLEFFIPGSSNSIYLGINHNKTDSINPVWVANRDAPVHDPFVMLMIDTTDGLLKISYRRGNITVSDSTLSAEGKNTSAIILDNGNLVLRKLNPDGSVNRTLWQSFDYPTDILLPGMKLGINFRTGHKWSLTSWVSAQIPASGSYTLGVDPNGTNQLVIWWQGNVYWTSGLWDKGDFSYTDFFGKESKFTYISNENEKYLTYSEQGNISFTALEILSDGNIVKTQGSGDKFVDTYFHVCSDSGNLSPGCVSKILPKCRKADVQFYVRRVSYEDPGYIYQNQNLSLLDCAAKCSQNCSCIAFDLIFAYNLIYDNGTGCQIFNNARGFSTDEESGRVVYFVYKDEGMTWWVWLLYLVALGATVLPLILMIIRIRRRGKELRAEEKLLHELADTNIPPEQHSGVIDKVEKKIKNQVHQFSFQSLEMATNNFSTENKLGEGGFGSVYKGTLPSGKEIAIKRLSRNSRQGLSEFKNEFLLIAKLQHENLIRTLGCCFERQEKSLVYEFMPNKSLDFFLFDPSRRELIKWAKRMNIIEGVAQGLLYLHKYSRTKVIHRDLKVSNVLLDEKMNPKISDFGMARIFGKQESEANTKRIVGTHGYMSPEYVKGGVISTKSDVFSFGVLLLEIVCGKKNHGRYHSERPLNLIGLAWELWVEGRAIELMDPTLNESNHKNEILRCINIGLLCVQDNATDRPSMTDVISMLTNESLPLPQPKQPAFFMGTSTQEAEIEVDAEKTCTNDLSFSDMEGR